MVVLKARKLTAGRPRRHECLESDALVRAALSEMERTGIDGFSLRAAARAIGCDPATLIYRFGSREGLERAVADRLHAEIGRLDPDHPWRDRLLVMARQYRAVAQTYPRTFPVLMRYWTTGPRDLLLTEDCFRALSDAGVPRTGYPPLNAASMPPYLAYAPVRPAGLWAYPLRPSLTTSKLSPVLTRCGATCRRSRRWLPTMSLRSPLVSCSTGSPPWGTGRRPRKNPHATSAQSRGSPEPMLFFLIYALAAVAEIACCSAFWRWARK